MRLHYDRKGKLRGYSDNLENVVAGDMFLGAELGFFVIFFIIAPFATYWLAKNYKKWGKKSPGWKSPWNPNRNPIPFIIINIIWGLVLAWMISGEAFKKVRTDYQPPSDYKRWEDKELQKPRLRKYRTLKGEEYEVWE